MDVEDVITEGTKTGKIETEEVLIGKMKLVKKITHLEQARQSEVVLCHTHGCGKLLNRTYSRGCAYLEPSG